MSNSSPKIARLFLKILLKKDNVEHRLGDFEEAFNRILEKSGKFAARKWYWKQTFFSLPDLVSINLYWRINMIASHIKSSFRYLYKNKKYSIINLASLVLGLISSLLILLWVVDEFNFDKFHEKHERIFRVSRKYMKTNLHFASAAYPIAPALKKDYPQIEDAVRILVNREALVQHQNNFFEEKGIYVVEPQFFKLFTIETVAGELENSIASPTNVLISDITAEKIFGSKNPIGENLMFDHLDQKMNFAVSGVFKSLPHNSHFHPEIILPFAMYDSYLLRNPGTISWSNNQFKTYILLKEGADIKSIGANIGSFMDRNYKPKASEFTSLGFTNLADIHLFSKLRSEIEPGGNITIVYILLIISLCILLIACINYINLTTAFSANRGKEVGIRKAIGARRGELVWQYLNESFLLAFLAIIVSVAAVKILLPYFNNLVEKQLTFNFFENPFILIGLILLGLLIGLISGIYPALLLSKYNPSETLYVRSKFFSGKVSLRRALVVVQFSVTIILIIGVSFISQQFNFFINNDPGFDEEQVIVLPSSEQMINNLPAFKARLMQNPKIKSVSANERVPSEQLSDWDDAYSQNGDSLKVLNYRVFSIKTDFDYAKTLGLQIIAGRDFNQSSASDSTESFILNEGAIKKLGIDSPQEAINKPFGYGKRRGVIIGVVKDFHFEPLFNEIAPIVFFPSKDELYNIALKIAGKDYLGTIDFLKNMWGEFRPNRPFDYYFINKKFDDHYASILNIQKIFGIFSFISILIACMGLFGLASFMAKSKTKEIGIRKVFGANVFGLVFSFLKDFSILVLISCAIAFPAAYYFTNYWLQEFAYKISISWTTFVFCGALALIIASITVSFEALKAAKANPADSLKAE